MNHSTLKKLWMLAEEVTGKEEDWRCLALEEIGLNFNRPLEHSGYDCTPANTLMFAGTGGDGVHFSFLLHEKQVTLSSPVVMTVPCNGGICVIVGEDLTDFLCLGMRFGFFVLEQLTYKREEFIQAYADPHWTPHEKHHFWTGYEVTIEKQHVLDRLKAKFGVGPWAGIRERLLELETKYLDLLE